MTKSITVPNLNQQFIIEVIRHYRNRYNINAIIMYLKDNICIMEEGVYEFPNNKRETGFYWLNPETAKLEKHNVI